MKMQMQQRARCEQLKVNQWNTIYRIGQPVRVTLDDGSKMKTKTRSDAWIMDGPLAVLLVDGISGAYSLDRVHGV